MACQSTRFTVTKATILLGRTDHCKLNPATLDEYLNAYWSRTEWLSARFLNSAAAFRYFEWSFMISMVEKICRLNLYGCEKQLEYMKKALSDNYDEFISCSEILDFERNWMKMYVRE